MPPERVAPVVEQYRAKAVADLHAAEVLAAGGADLTDAVCFHCQQAVEKLLKAALLATGTEPPRTHDVGYLLEVLDTLRPVPAELGVVCAQLADLGVAPRYPGWDAEELGIDAARLLEATKHGVELLLVLLDPGPAADHGTSAGRPSEGK